MASPVTTPGAGATPYARRARRRRWVVLLPLLLVLGVVLEVAVIIGVVRLIGGWWTIGLLLAESALGAWLVTREGGRAWRALREAVRSGTMPGREVADAMLVLLGGLLLLLPGFVTDVIGFVLVLPFTRGPARRLLARVVGGRMPPSVTRPAEPGEVLRGRVVDE